MVLIRGRKGFLLIFSEALLWGYLRPNSEFLTQLKVLFSSVAVSRLHVPCRNFNLTGPHLSVKPETPADNFL